MVNSPASSTSPISHPSRWRPVLRIVGVLLIVGVLGWWLAAGQNPGWTKDRIAITKTDEITGIEYTEYEKRLVPGVDLLIAGSGLGLVLITATLFSRRKSQHLS